MPRGFVEQMFKTNERLARKSGHEKEREELVCRLLASGMPVEQISLILKIRKEEIRIIESNNVEGKIPEYMRTYKARVKSRERVAKDLATRATLGKLSSSYAINYTQINKELADENPHV